MNWILAAVFVYILLQLLVAYVASRKVRNEEDFLLAGRSLGPWMATFTVFATWFGAETCIGAAGEAYDKGLAGVQTDPFGYGAAILVFGLLFAATLWKRGIVTLADLYRQRYGIGVERLAAIVMIPTSLLWAAAQIRAFSHVLAASSEWGSLLAMTIAAAVVIVYTTVGGLWADAVTDLVQGIVLILGIVLVGALVLFQDGGLGHLQQLPAEQLQLVATDTSWLATAEAFAVPILGSLVAQELASRVLAMRSPELARRATIGAGFIYLAVGLVPVTLGLIAVQYVGELDEPEQVIMHLAQTQLPTWLYILFIGALVSAILSTVNSALLVAGSLAAHNIVLPLKPGLGDAQKLRFNRIAVVCFGLVAYGLALSAESVYALVEEASSLGSSGLLVILVFALWIPGVGGRLSGYAAVLTGLASYLLASHAFAYDYPFLLSLALALLAYLATALFSRPATQTAAQGAAVGVPQ